MISKGNRFPTLARLVFVALISACASQAPKVTDEEVRREYDKIVARLQLGKEYAVRHIIVETRPQAETAIRRLKSGEAFSTVARELSADPGSREKGGDLGWSLPEHFVPEFSREMVSLAPSGLSSTPVQTRFGWHVIEVTGVRDQQPPPFEEVKEKIAQRLQQARAK